MGHHEFITAIESWGSGATMLDVVTLKDGSVMMITDSAIVLFADRDDFECGRGGRVLRRREEPAPAVLAEAPNRPALRAVS
jgi:hypothetical protein